MISCSTSSVRITPVQSTCRYLKHLHVGSIRISTVSEFGCPVSHSLIGHTDIDVKYA